MVRLRTRPGELVARDEITLPPMGIDVSSTVTAGVAVTVGVVNVAGLWTELIASNASESSFLKVSVGNASASNVAQPMLMDIAVGAAAAEAAIVSSICMGQSGTTSASVSWVFPVSVPAGARISCRITTSIAAANAPVVHCVSVAAAGRATRRTPRNLVTHGANVGTSTGVAIGSNNTWVEIISATTEPFMGLVMTWGGNDSTTALSDELISLGIGAGASEQLMQAIPTCWTAAEAVSPRISNSPVARHIPAGTRIAMKVATGTTSTGAGVVFGVPYT